MISALSVLGECHDPQFSGHPYKMNLRNIVCQKALRHLAQPDTEKSVNLVFSHTINDSPVLLSLHGDVLCLRTTGRTQCNSEARPAVGKPFDWWTTLGSKI